MSEIMTDNIVSDWLKSLNLDCYAQDFFDNGYDELEVCKQIGDPDLDAIGVTKGTHRKKLLQAVTRLREEGGTSVYFTLEDTESVRVEEPGAYCSDSGDYRLSYTSSNDGQKNKVRSDRNYSKKKQAPVSYPPLQLKIITRDKLFEDGINLSSPPYTNQDNTACKSSLTALAVKYASELNTYVEETAPVAAAVEDGSGQILPVRSTPPPIPVCPPPQVSHMDKNMDLRSVYSRSDSSNYQATYIPLDSDYEEIEKKKTSTLGRFFRNIGFRRSGKKHNYKLHNGDLNAYEITMNDDDRMALMLMVKEGKITIEHALEVVKRFEDERKKELQQLKSYYNKKKKQKDNKPVKSPSAIYTDSARRCDVCQRIVSNDPHLPMMSVCGDPSHRNECFQHRRVHSVSHIDYSPSHASPQIARAMSCSPTRVQLPHSSSVVNSPVNLYSPSHHPKIYAPVLMQEVKAYKGMYGGYYHHGDSVYHDRSSALRTSACVHDSPSRTSLVSTGSEHSECQAHSLMHADVAAMRNDDLNYCSNSSAMSVSSSASPAIGVHHGVCKHAEEERSRSAKARYPTGTTKSASSVESSFQSPSPGSGKSNYSMDDGSNVVSDYCHNMVIVHTNYEPAKIETDMLSLKFSYVEPLKHVPETSGGQRKDFPPQWQKRSKPTTVKEFLQQHLEKTFIDNGFDHLECFLDLCQNDLNALNILNPQHQARLLSASKVLIDSEEVSDHIVRQNTPCYNQTPVCLSPVVKNVECHHTRPCPASRDSGCYASSEHIYPREGFHKLLLNTQPVPQAFVERHYSPMHSNKENLKPSNMYRI
ncbi:hypothetical protein KUTeg_007341 [Tegillarca granosa]|uniref:SAM domain-containing protein n=1 Tax=Tegillarca granosa TaxID=220873 RepID=A0ABQ9FG99_TEGGR|nr:hypothetical protein KUTeg_007341 [Tegillarca granosa]